MSSLIGAFLTVAFGIIQTIHSRQLAKRQIYAKLNAPGTSNISPLQKLWEKEYENSSTPFDIEEPGAWIAALAKSGKIRGEVLDAGCGPGRNSIYLAGLGYSVLGVDISAHAIERARQKASSKDNSARFLQADLC
jgi:2-polyprenyl-3-methyl-5-hydroxy-6-metoxy-1,4-benzoquinol methylase